MATFLSISRVANGTLIALTHEDGERVEHVVQDSDEERQAVEAWREALGAIYEKYGPTKSRYSRARLWLTVAPGDKCEDPILEDTLFQ